MIYSSPIILSIKCNWQYCLLHWFKNGVNIVNFDIRLFVGTLEMNDKPY